MTRTLIAPALAAALLFALATVSYAQGPLRNVVRGTVRGVVTVGQNIRNTAPVQRIVNARPLQNGVQIRYPVRQNNGVLYPTRTYYNNSNGVYNNVQQYNTNPHFNSQFHNQQPQFNNFPQSNGNTRSGGFPQPNGFPQSNSFPQQNVNGGNTRGVTITFQ